MGFYDLSKDERQKLVNKTEEDILQAILDLDSQLDNKEKITVIPEIIRKYASDSDTYIRKNAYKAIGRLYWVYTDLREKILHILDEMLKDSDEKVRQTSVYALGEIGMKDNGSIMKIFEKALTDEHHSVRNAVIGALKQMGQKNPEPTFEFVRKHFHDDDPKIRREMVHGIELRGRTHPEEVLPLLEELQDENVKEVRSMVIHVVGQISYKKTCLETVVDSLKTWKNLEIVREAAEEILKVHRRYKFAARSPEDAENYIKEHLPDILV
jgi:HEAT repeat protein